MKKRILHILNYGASYRGNFIESLECLNQKIESSDLENIYLFTKEAYNEKSIFWIDKLREDGRLIFNLTGSLKQNIKLVKKIVKEENVVLIHTHFITKKHFLPVMFSVGTSTIPVLMHMHNHVQDTNSLVKKMSRRWMYRNCYMVGCSESVFESIKRNYPRNKSTFIDNGVNFDRLDDYANITNSELELPEGDKILLIFGFDFYRKGVDLAIKAVDMLRRQGKKYALAISLSTNFEMVENNIVSILGNKPNWIKVISARNDVASLYNSCNLFLSPSREEGLPYSVVEAAYCKCAVVMSDISAQRNLKIPYGTWFKAEDVNGLVNAIIEADSKQKGKLEHLEDVQNNIRQAYSMRVWADKVANLYESLLK